MNSARPGFDVHRFSAKLRQAARELRRAGHHGPAGETLADRLETHAEAMLRPEGNPRYQPFSLRAERLAG